MRVSHGCIRLYPEGIEELFGMVAPGTKVNIINQPMKVGWFGDSMYLEFHAPLGEDARTLEQNIAEARETVHKSTASRGLPRSRRCGRPCRRLGRQRGRPRTGQPARHQNGRRTGHRSVLPTELPVE